ncbi:MAG: prolyl oligopeptidase family serine peptidase [Casimicrobiaceae bacterium]
MSHRPGIVLAVLGIALSAAVIASAQTRPAAPAVREVADTFFGTTVADPYRYFENVKDPEVAAWIKAEAEYATATLHKIRGRDALLSEIAERGDAVSARVFDVQVVGRYVYYQKRLATENIPKLYVREGFGGKERRLVDPERIVTPDGKHSALDYYAPSQDNRYLAYGISPAGSEASVLRVLEVATGKETGDVIDRAQYADPSWLPDGRFMYSRLQKLAADAPVTDKYQNQRVFVHRLGEDPDRDTPLFGAGVSSLAKVAPTELSFAFNPPGSPYVIAQAVNGVQREFRLYAAPLAALDGANTPWVMVADNADAVTGLAVQGETIFLMTHQDAPRFRVVRLSLRDPKFATAQTVVPAGDAVITGIAAASDGLYVRKMNGGSSELFRLANNGNAAMPIKLPFSGDLDGLDTDPRQPGAVFNLVGWTRSGGYYAYDPKAGKVTDTRLQPLGKYDNPANLVAIEVKAKAPDGTLVPLSIVHRKGLVFDGTNPTIVYGYGAYGIPQTPFFRPTWLAWFDRGGVLAVAHVRGGGEFGQEWHKAGFQATKPNTWRDAIACAEWLIANKYTSPAKISIMGGSAGGIFVGRAITERPELFGAAVDQVPVSDTLRAEFSANGVPNIPEFGTVTTEAGFKALFAMSPYHAVKDGVKYPAVLLTTGFNDPRVDVWEAAKMTARLQAASTSGKPILMRVDYDAGHGFGSTKKQQYEERADTFAFLFWQAGVKGFAP